MICKFCNAEMEDSHKFCPFCGKDQSESAEPEQGRTVEPVQEMTAEPVVEKPKKKRKKHIQIVHAIPETLQEKLLLQKEIRNEDIKRAIKLYTRSGMNK